MPLLDASLMVWTPDQGGVDYLSLEKTDRKPISQVIFLSRADESECVICTKAPSVSRGKQDPSYLTSVILAPCHEATAPSHPNQPLTKLSLQF